LKKTLFGIAALFGLALAAVLIGPGFVDWNSYKGRIAEQAMAVTGRAVQIDGDVSLRIVPATEFTAAKVRIANAGQSSDADMAAVERLEVRVAFWPLLKGQVQVESVSLVEPRVLLEVYPDGSNNWTFEPADEASPQADTAESGDAGETASNNTLRIDRLSLRRATLLYRDAVSGLEERVENLDADVLADSLSGPFSIRGQARFKGQDIEFDTVSSRWRDAGATQISATLLLPGLQTKAHFTGNLSQHGHEVSLRGRTKLSGDDLSANLVAFSLTDGPLAALARPFRVEAAITADSAHIVASEVLLALADVEISGEAELSHQTPRKARVTLSASRLDLDSLLAAVPAVNADRPTTTGKESPSASSAAGQPTPASGFIIPEDLEGSVQLVVDAAIYRQQVLRQMLFNAEVTDGRLVVSEAAVLLPGGSDIAMSGVLSTPEGKPTFDGRIDGAADNLRAVMQWLGMDVRAIPAERLRKMTYSSRLTATADLLTLSDMDLRVDVTRINGGISVAMRERPGLGIGLAVDRLDLDAYLPKNQPNTAAATAGDNRLQNPGQGAVSGNAGRNGLPALSFLDAFDANLDLRIGRLDYNDASARNLHLDGTLQAATMTLRSLDIADLAGSSVRASGSVGSLTSQPDIDGRILLKVSDPSRLDAVFGKSARDLARLGSFTLDSKLQGTLENLSVGATLTAQGGEASAAGRISSIAADPTFDLAIDAHHPDFGGLLRVLSPDTGFGGGLGDFTLAAQLTGSPDSMTFDDLRLRAGKLNAEGRITADFSGVVPLLSVTLSTGEITVSDLISDGSPSGAGRNTSRKGTAGGTNGAGPSWQNSRDLDPDGQSPEIKTADLSGVHDRWSRARIDLSVLEEADGDIELVSKAIVIDDLRLEKPRIEAVLNSGILSVRRFEAGLYGGTIQATGAVDGRNGAAIDLAITSSGMNAGQLVRQLTDSDRISGILDVSASLAAKGTSEAALVRSLSGTGRLGGKLSAKVKAEEQIGSALLGLLGDKVREIKGVGDATSALFGAFAGTPADLSGTFKVDRGIAETADTRIDGRDASISIAGTTDLPVWLLASRSELFRSQDSDRKDPYVIAEVKGPLDTPNVRVSGQAFKRSGSGTSGSSKAGSGKVNTEDVLRGLLKGLAR
jgi:uncharacterized protein involved in outer membrane biogenesis